MTSPQEPNQRWSLHTGIDSGADSGRSYILVVVDDFTQECLCRTADTSLTGARVMRELDLLITRRGRPQAIVSDHWVEFASKEVQRWALVTGIEWHYVSLRKPTYKSLRQRFIGGTRA